jgi:hypothetical protein
MWNFLAACVVIAIVLTIGFFCLDLILMALFGLIGGIVWLVEVIKNKIHGPHN